MFLRDGRGLNRKKKITWTSFAEFAGGGKTRIKTSAVFLNFKYILMIGLILFLPLLLFAEIECEEETDNHEESHCIVSIQETVEFCSIDKKNTYFFTVQIEFNTFVVDNFKKESPLFHNFQESGSEKIPIFILNCSFII